MFLGEYLHTFDSKNRISLPSKFRKDLGRVVVVTRGLDHCLYIYSRKAWEKEARHQANSPCTSGLGLTTHIPWNNHHERPISMTRDVGTGTPEEIDKLPEVRSW